MATQLIEQPVRGDQASALRALAEGRSSRAKVIAVTSGKGGVGKTNVAVNLGIILAERTERVILVDADLGLANVDILLGRRFRYTMEHVIKGEKDVFEIMQKLPGGLAIVPGASGFSDLANLKDQERAYLFRSLSMLERYADVILIDTGAGVSRNVVQFAAAADEVLVVATPDPTSMTDAYALIKLLSQEDSLGAVKLLVNLARNRAEGEVVSQRIASVAMKFLNLVVEQTGIMTIDPVLASAVRERRPVVLSHPKCTAARDIRRLADAFHMDGRHRQSHRTNGLIERMKALLGTGRDA